MALSRDRVSPDNVAYRVDELAAQAFPQRDGPETDFTSGKKVVMVEARQPVGELFQDLNIYRSWRVP
jgi:hypothetical protein